jgi:hypothetical protein
MDDEVFYLFIIVACTVALELPQTARALLILFVVLYTIAATLAPLSSRRHNRHGHADHDTTS